MGAVWKSEKFPIFFYSQSASGGRGFFGFGENSQIIPVISLEVFPTKMRLMCLTLLYIPLPNPTARFCPTLKAALLFFEFVWSVWWHLCGHSECLVQWHLIISFRKQNHVYNLIPHRKELQKRCNFKCRTLFFPNEWELGIYNKYIYIIELKGCIA